MTIFLPKYVKMYVVNLLLKNIISECMLLLCFEEVLRVLVEYNEEHRR